MKQSSKSSTSMGSDGNYRAGGFDEELQSGRHIHVYNNCNIHHHHYHFHNEANDADNVDPPQLLTVKVQEPLSSNMDHNVNDDLASMPDVKLEQTIKRLRKNIDSGFFVRLPDRGQKIIDSLKNHEKEYQQRKLWRTQSNGLS